MNRRILLALAGAGALALALTACTSGTAPTASPTTTAADDHPDDTPAIAAAREFETDNDIAADDFFDTEPDGGKPGTLLVAERYDGWKIPEAKTWRIAYDSVNAAGEQVATSAAVVVPYGVPPEGGWPVISWAHGTSGVTPHCGPTRMLDLYYPDVVLDFVQAGYAVVATDYAGLGIEGGGHEYATMPPNADDTRYAIPAAREAVPELGEQWVAIGHSQGGQSAWGVASRNSHDHAVDGLLGAVALAPATPFDASMAEAVDSPGVGALGLYVAASIHLQYPDVAVEDLLTEAGLAKYDEVTDSCLALVFALVEGGTIRDYVKPEFAELPEVRRYFAGNVYTDVPLEVPVLAVSGSDDDIIKAVTVADVVAKQQATGGDVTYLEVAGDHDRMIKTSWDDVLAWIGARFGD